MGPDGLLHLQVGRPLVGPGESRRSHTPTLDKDIP